MKHSGAGGGAEAARCHAHEMGWGVQNWAISKKKKKMSGHALICSFDGKARDLTSVYNCQLNTHVLAP